MTRFGSVQTFQGVPVLNKPHLLGKGPYRGLYLEAGAYKHHRIVFDDPDTPVGHKNSIALDMNGMAIVRDFTRCWLVNNAAMPGNTAPIILHLHTGSVGLVQTDNDQSIASVVSQNVTGQVLTTATWLPIASVFAPLAPLEDLHSSSERCFWSGAITADKSFKLDWRTLLNSTGSIDVLTAQIDAVLDPDGNYGVSFGSCFWDFKAGSSTVVPPMNARMPLQLGYRSILRVYNTDGASSTASWITGTVSR